MTLSRAEILSRTSLRRELVDCPEWGGEVWVREMTAAERDRIEARFAEGGASLEGVRAAIACVCCVDEDGQALFEATDVPDLEQLSAAPLERIFEVALELSAFTASDVDALSGK